MLLYIEQICHHNHFSRTAASGSLFLLAWLLLINLCLITNDLFVLQIQVSIIRPPESQSPVYFQMNC